jgi:hypothetical protein
MAAAPQQIIFQWLERIGLGHAIPMFQSQGITTPQALIELTYERYDGLGVFDSNERKRLSELVTRVQEAARKSRPATALPPQPTAPTVATAVSSALNDGSDEEEREAAAPTRQGKVQPSRMSILPHVGGSRLASDAERVPSATAPDSVAPALVVSSVAPAVPSRALLPRRAGGFDRDGFEARRVRPPPQPLAGAAESSARLTAGDGMMIGAEEDGHDTATGGSPAGFDTSDGDAALEAQLGRVAAASAVSSSAVPPAPPARRAFAVGVMPSARAAMAKRQSTGSARPGSDGSVALTPTDHLQQLPPQPAPPLPTGIGAASAAAAKRPKAISVEPSIAAASALSPRGQAAARLPLVGFLEEACAREEAEAPRISAPPSGPPVLSTSAAGAASSQAAMQRLPSAASLSWGLGSGVFDSGGPRIKVVVRKRPMSRRELRANELDTVQAVSRRTVLVHEPRQKVDLTRYTETYEFSFDEVRMVQLSGCASVPCQNQLGSPVLVRADV